MKHTKKRPETTQLKRLLTRRRQLGDRRKELTQARADLDRDIHDTLANLDEVRAEIRQLQGDQKEPVVTEHAILRYLERVDGIDIEAVKEKILTPAVVRAAAALGNGKFPSDTGFRAVVANNTIVTIET